MVSAGKAKPCSEQIDRSLRYTQTRKMRPAAAIETRRNPNAAAWPEASRAGNLTTGGQSEFVQDGLPGHAPEAAKDTEGQNRAGGALARARAGLQDRAAHGARRRPAAAAESAKRKMDLGARSMKSISSNDHQ
jgi:hypothetical protein